MYSIPGDHAWPVDLQQAQVLSQERSKLTIDALLEATTHVLAKARHDKAIANEIAAVAGGQHRLALPAIPKQGSADGGRR